MSPESSDPSNRGQPAGGDVPHGQKEGKPEGSSFFHNVNDLDIGMQGQFQQCHCGHRGSGPELIWGD